MIFKRFRYLLPLYRFGLIIAIFIKVYIWRQNLCVNTISNQCNDAEASQANNRGSEDCIVSVVDFENRQYRRMLKWYDTSLPLPCMTGRFRRLTPRIANLSLVQRNRCIGGTQGEHRESTAECPRAGAACNAMDAPIIGRSTARMPLDAPTVNLLYPTCAHAAPQAISHRERRERGECARA